MTTQEIEYKGVNLLVTGTYFKEGAWAFDSPADPEEFEIERIHIESTDVTELLEDECMDIEQKIILKYYR